MGVPRVGGVALVCEGKQETSIGFKWKWKEDNSNKRNNQGVEINKLHPHTNKVLCTYKSISEASRQTNISHSSLYAACNRMLQLREHSSALALVRSPFDRVQVHGVVQVVAI